MRADRFSPVQRSRWNQHQQHLDFLQARTSVEETLSHRRADDFLACLHNHEAQAFGVQWWRQGLAVGHELQHASRRPLCCAGSWRHQ